MWISQLAAPELIGKPLATGLPFSLISSLNIENEAGFEHCGMDAARWAAHAGDPNYNLLNECCLALNSGNPGATGFTTIAQKNMEYMINAGRGRSWLGPVSRCLRLLTAGRRRKAGTSHHLELGRLPGSLGRAGLPELLLDDPQRLREVRVNAKQRGRARENAQKRVAHCGR